MKVLLAFMYLLVGVQAFAQSNFKKTVLCNDTSRVVLTDASLTDLGNGKVTFHYYNSNYNGGPTLNLDLVGYNLSHGKELSLEDLSNPKDEYILFDKEGNKTNVSIKMKFILPNMGCNTHSRAPCHIQNGGFGHKNEKIYTIHIENDDVNFTKTCSIYEYSLL